jgi:hypothetical protein
MAKGDKIVLFSKIAKHTFAAAYLLAFWPYTLLPCAKRYLYGPLAGK